ncbi:uncharacterized protein LOC113295325 [Papaver somniferum]|uniref:uncharacterized protein LOC113295325 n=1 Tax=Papaver somniferum TaxID=3469 RepID=UPI000E6F89A7|nr:uncharacterized protein LOC113295325 [Papaver somniferum]
MYSNWIADIYENSEIEIMTTKCWLIWKERCLRIFQSKSTTSIQLSLAVQRHLAFWAPLRQLKHGVINNTTSVLHSHIDINASRWSKPQVNHLKINFDASWFDFSTPAGYGIILRDDTGGAIQATGGTFRASTAEEAEALSMLETTNWAKRMDLKNFSVEGDCQRLILYAQDKQSNIFWRNKAIVSEAVKILKTCENFLGFMFKNRNGNEVADTLAKEARKQGIHKQQWVLMPHFLNSALLSDVCFSNSANISSLQNGVNIMLVDTNISNPLDEIRKTNILDNRM